MKHRSGWRHTGVIGLVLLLLLSMLGCEQNRQGGEKGNGGNVRISQSNVFSRLCAPGANRNSGAVSCDITKFI